MPNSYAYIEDNFVKIGNDYLEREFSINNGHLLTTKITNKRIKGEKLVVAKPSSAEFYIGLREKKRFKTVTNFISSNDLTIDNINVLKRRVEFVFKPYKYLGVPITFIMNVEIEDNCHYMHKNIEMMVEPEKQHLITIDYIDCEHIVFDTPEQQWSIGKTEKVFLDSYYMTLGQPFYINGMFFGSEFPLAENKIADNTAYIRYYSGKRFDTLKLNCGHTFKTWNTVVGAARGLEKTTIRDDFFRYIRNIARDIEPRFQYNSWYDYALDITNENISKSFKEIEKNLSKTLVPPLASYVVDDGFVDYKSDFWSFNSKFPEELYPASTLARKFSSNFGLWLGPRGGYNSDTPHFARRMEKSGKGGFNRRAFDVCVSHPEYIKNVTKYFIESMDKFDINYWKLDGFLLKACPNKNHGHMTGGYHDMYEYTEMWENWIDVFRKIRLHRESAGKSLWINQTSYCNPSPWFLQWSDSLWIQNSDDIGRLSRGAKGEKLSDRDVDKTLSYRDQRYYSFSVKDDYQFPIEYLYNHDPIYGSFAKIEMTDAEYRNFMFMTATRGNAFWELYYSYSMFSPEKWLINADALRFIRNNFDILRTSRFIGTPPSQSGVYGYSSWIDGRGIVSLRNSANRKQTFKLTLDKSIGVYENFENMKRVSVYPYTNENDEKRYSYGDTINITLEPTETVIMKFSSAEEKTPQLVYGRFNSSRELLLFFDDRVYFGDSNISSDCPIESVTLLDDYSTLRVTFAQEVDSTKLSFVVKNAFGDASNVEYSGKNYPNFICDDMLIPCGRDFTVDLLLDKINDGRIIDCNGIINVSVHNNKSALRFGESISHGDTELKNGDRITVVCEPNGLLKLYINGQLECSVYNESYCVELENCEIAKASDVSWIKVLSKALSYDEM